ncbi:MAG: tetratricopeptide repeat protein [Alphaproteobacteria bacterium]|nr:tetratricopeptide repeat protein [Alphaproteobacteria bacterium]
MFGLLLLLLLPPPAEAATPRQTRRAAKLADDAEQAFADGELSRAYRHSTRAIELDEGNALAYQVRGVTLLVASEQPDNPMADEQRQEAELMLRICAELDPVGPVGALARDLIARIEARGLIAEPSPECSAEATAALEQAEAAFQAQALDEAHQHYQRALALCPGAVPWYTWYGDVWFAQRDFEKAVDLYQQSLDLDPCFWPAHRFIADARAHQGRMDQALEEAARAVACNPSYGFGWTFLDALAMRAGGVSLRVDVDKPAILPTPEGAELLLPNEQHQAPGFRGGIGLLYATAKVSAGDTLSPLQRERAAVRQVLVFVRQSAAELPDEDLAIWALLAQADAEGYLDEAIFVLLLDEDLLPEFLEYRDRNLERLVRYVRSYLVVGV